MQNELINDVELLIENYKNNIPAGYKFWKGQKTSELDSLDKFFQILLGLFKEEEKAIAKEQRRPYVTDTYENNVRRFAKLLVITFLEYPIDLGVCISYMHLLGQKHMAYAFYYELDTFLGGRGNNVLEDEEYTKCLYRGLLEFYRTFYGSFQDNEEAIRLICKYYPKEADSWLKHEDVINALYDHIRIAGSATDFGYAFRGIEQIQQYIHGLPNELIIELLNEYRLYDVLNQSVYRHQMFAIIDGSELTGEEKYVLKFFYLDSLLLANIFNGVWIERERKYDKGIVIYRNSYEEKLGQEQIQVLKNPKAYWDTVKPWRREFLVNGKSEAIVFLAQQDEIDFNFRGNREYFPFEYNDWVLESYRTGQTEGKLNHLISGDLSREQHKNPMTFSLLYLDDYRGINRRILDFDHRFAFDPDNRELKHQEKEQNPELHFYGKSVHSLSCIVGKNGTGKTSIVDFLKDTFYKMLKVMEDFGIPCEEGYVKLRDFNQYKIIDEPVTFLVVFRFGKEDYFLTNIDDISSIGVSPYQTGIYRNIDFCKVAYFSQQFTANQAISIENEKIGREDVSGISRTLEGLGQCDYSETKSFLLRKNAMDTFENLEELGSLDRDLCYQFSLLRHIGVEKFCKYIDISPERELMIYSLKSGEILEKFTLKECHNISRIKELEEKYAQMPGVAIGFVSSGQYAKFMFLAKLHWFLKGYHEDSVYYKNMFGRQVFPMEDALQQDETALIFIDEGEVYYHPEWQRRYLSILLDMLCLVEGKARVQVVFTTNSPFVISDVLREDVQYLSDKKDEIGETLGQNIHKLLIKNFFMDYTIGEYSRKLIETIVCQLTDEKSIKSEAVMDIHNYFDNAQDKYRMIGFLIQQIGEPIYRDKLEKMLERRLESMQDTKESRIRELERQKEDLEKKLAQLKGEMNDTD